MQKLIQLIIFSLTSFYASAQTNLILNGTFENTTSTWTNWSSTSGGTNLWGGQGACTANGGLKSIWMGDQTQATGINNAVENLYQTVTIPSTATSCVLDFYVSINTEEISTSTAYDHMYVRLRSSTGTLLLTFAALSNLHGDYQIPGCKTWVHYINGTVPSTYFGQTVRISVEFDTDSGDPTIFRLDDISLMATTSSPCTYSLSQPTYTCANASANAYSNIATVSTQAGCSWTALVIPPAGSWLGTTSTGTGSGSLSIYVMQNTSPNPRTGTISVNGQTIAVTQPGTCSYTLSQNTYTCANAAANTFSNIATITTQSSCNWTANVTSGSTWLSTSSAGSGSGSLSITVLANTSGSTRNGTIDINGQTISITQPAGCSYTLSQSNYACANASAGTFSSILLVNTQSTCAWAATVTSGNSWLSTTSAGTGSGAISITVLQNTTTGARNGTIDINGQTLTITQPGVVCTYSLSLSTYNCINALANTYNTIGLVTTQTPCIWAATVTSGTSWLATASSGTGSGAISIIVLQNTGNSRSGTIDINGQILTIIQPAAGTGINEIENQFVSIFPNPAQSEITIAARREMIGKDFAITNNLGQILIQGKINNLSTLINMESLSAGIYFFRINHEGTNIKLIKN